jgi:hypothetical protein
VRKHYAKWSKPRQDKIDSLMLEYVGMSGRARPSEWVQFGYKEERRLQPLSAALKMVRRGGLGLPASSRSDSEFSFGCVLSAINRPKSAVQHARQVPGGGGILFRLGFRLEARAPLGTSTWQGQPRAEPPRSRFCLSHFPPPRTT